MQNEIDKLKLQVNMLKIQVVLAGIRIGALATAVIKLAGSG